ncbi:MAG: tetratricopeptide repeat protein [Myxococcaceae bacterium]|nr:tetratricopeptide repeat protein [Myxococcaceae bacterium]
MFHPLHQSPLFLAQADRYEELGPRAWSEGIVPWRVTTCPLLADVEAHLIAAFARACTAAGALGRDEQLTVIDVGAGTGRMGFHLAPRLAALGVRAEVVLTDVASSNLEALGSQPQLAELARGGLVSVEHFDALTPRRLRPGGATVLLAHYLFDTLPHRVFRRAADGATFEGLIDDAVEPWAWRYEPASLPPGLGSRPPGTWLIPVGAAAALEAWRRTFPGALLVLAADKGVSPRGPHDDPLLARHGSVSAGVDFDVLAQLAAPAWRHLGPRDPSDVFALHAFTTSGSTTIDDAWRDRGSGNEVLRLHERFEACGDPTTGIDALLDFLESTGNDPDLLAQRCDRLRETPLTEAQAHRAVQLLASAAPRHFVFRQHFDVPFNLAVTAHHLGALRLAVALYLRSLEESGAHPATLLNLALAQHALGDVERACECLDVLLEHEPAHPRAVELLASWRRGS